MYIYIYIIKANLITHNHSLSQPPIHGSVNSLGQATGSVGVEAKATSRGLTKVGSTSSSTSRSIPSNVFARSLMITSSSLRSWLGTGEDAFGFFGSGLLIGVDPVEVGGGGTAFFLGTVRFPLAPVIPILDGVGTGLAFATALP